MSTATMVMAEDRYLRAAREVGCPRDQLANFLDCGIVLQRRQLAASAAARLCDAEGGPTKIGYGGARGGGKSHWGIAQVVCDDCRRFDGLKFLYLRKVGKAGREAIEDLRRDVLHSTPHEYLASKATLALPNGSRVILGHYQTEKDIDNYLGLQYDGALVEEATQLTHQKVRDIDTCVRTSKPGWRPRMYLTFNPGGIGHAWVKKSFIEPARRHREIDTRFIQATVRDNQFVDRDYRAKLEALTGWQRRAWLDGDWDIAAGQFFTTWRRELHVKNAIAIQPGWRVWLSLDYGWVHFTVCHLFAESDDGIVYAVDEHAERRWQVADHCEAIRAMLARNGIRPERIDVAVAGGDMFSPEKDGTTIADHYAANGVPVTRANVDRVNGAAEVLRRLGDPDRDKPPTFFVSESCPRLIDCMPSLEHNPRKPEDVLKIDCDDDGLGGDDAYDSARYALMEASAARVQWIASPLDDRRW